MPRDWKNDPEAIRRYCYCEWVWGYKRASYDGVTREWQRVHSDDCRLHGTRPEHDLPPEFP